MFLIFSLLAFGLSGAVIAAAQAVAGVFVSGFGGADAQSSLIKFIINRIFIMMFEIGLKSPANTNIAYKKPCRSRLTSRISVVVALFSCTIMLFRKEFR